MSEFLLLGTRLAAPAQLSPARAGHDLAALATWHGWLRRFGLLRSFAVRCGRHAEPAACLVVRVSGQAAAQRLAARWESLAGYQVTVLPLIDPAADRSGSR
jgi:hypothetical protein